jgi:hypothetical protein
MNIRRLAKICVLAIGGLVSSNAHAATTLDFTGLQNQEQVLNYYNGGLGGNGSGPGPNYGVVFGTDSLALISSTVGGGGNFQNAPSNSIVFFLGGPGDVMDVAGGFNTGFSFYYSASGTGSVNVYSGLDGTGSLLATLNLPNSAGNGAPGCTYYYCDWQPVGVSFAGTAESAVFSGSANNIGFTDITLGSATPGAPGPLPGAGFVGLAALVLTGAAAKARGLLA